MGRLRLYRVYVGGAVYWMSLWEHETDLVAAANAMLLAIGDDEETASKVEEIKTVDLDKIEFLRTFDPNTGEDRTITVVQAHFLATKPEIHGCSEWP